MTLERHGAISISGFTVSIIVAPLFGALLLACYVASLCFLTAVELCRMQSAVYDKRPGALSFTLLSPWWLVISKANKHTSPHPGNSAPHESALIVI